MGICDDLIDDLWARAHRGTVECVSRDVHPSDMMRASRLWEIHSPSRKKEIVIYF